MICHRWDFLVYIRMASSSLSVPFLFFPLIRNASYPSPDYLELPDSCRFDIRIVELLHALSKTSPIYRVEAPYEDASFFSLPPQPRQRPEWDIKMSSPSRLPLTTSYRDSVNSLESSAALLPKPTVTHYVSDFTVAKHSFLTLEEVHSLDLTTLYGPN